MDINQKYETLVAMMAQISGNMKENKDKQAESSAPQTISGRFSSNRMETPSTNHVRDENRNQAKLPKIDFPYFNGECPREWVRKARKYFQLHQVADELKVGIAEMDLKGKAVIWFHGFAASHPNAEWNVFTIDDDEEVEVEGDGNSEQGEESEEVMQISISALLGTMKHKTIRIPGVVKGSKISILIDSGSTHSFIDERLVKGLKLKTDNEKNMLVTVANGQQLNSISICQSLVWQMQGLEFQFKLKALKLWGSDIVLGVDWLSQFGPTTFDFIQGSISFDMNGKTVSLTRERHQGEMNLIDGDQLRKIFNKQEYGIMAQLYAIEVEGEGKIHDLISPILIEFKDVFAEPTGLPPIRSKDHQIALK
ncbi:Uncharacterized protein Adt_27002 [Abeliophyllum distichum]|uniref:Uncharacterized protein n=1 Tax=Abeliophyllum distichum TaxID=126358 RepID=A0ABD1RSH4_9LAMI